MTNFRSIHVSINETNIFFNQRNKTFNLGVATKPEVMARLRTGPGTPVSGPVASGVGPGTVERAELESGSKASVGPATRISLSEPVSNRFKLVFGNFRSEFLVVKQNNQIHS